MSVNNTTEKVKIIDSAGNVVAVTSNALNVNIVSETPTFAENIAQWGGVNTSLGQKVMASSVPVVLASDQTPISTTNTQVLGSLSNGTETTVAGSAVQIIAVNASRKYVIIQNTGNANIRVGITGVTTTTGLRIVPNGSEVLAVGNAIFAIREGAISSTAFTQEIT